MVMVFVVAMVVVGAAGVRCAMLSRRFEWAILQGSITINAFVRTSRGCSVRDRGRLVL